jgi:hypothetical protein
MFTSFDKPVDKEKMRAQRLAEHELPSYASKKNRRNNYGYNPQEQQNLTYTGMGMDINVHDQWAVESLGRIQDRTREHLGKTDAGIIRYRKKLRAAIDALQKPDSAQHLPMTNGVSPASITGPVSNDTITDSQDWRRAFVESDAERRANCTGWNAGLPE